MPANIAPIFVLTPNIGFGRITAANTTSDGSGSLTTVFTAGANGSRLDFLTITNSQATAALSSAMVIKVYLTNTSGTTPRMLQEVTLPAATRTTAVVGSTTTISFSNGLIIPAGTLVQMSQSVYAGVQDQNDVVARGGDY
jgi:hypothetical protein